MRRGELPPPRGATTARGIGSVYGIGAGSSSSSRPGSRQPRGGGGGSPLLPSVGGSRMATIGRGGGVDERLQLREAERQQRLRSVDQRAGGPPSTEALVAALQQSKELQQQLQQQLDDERARHRRAEQHWNAAGAAAVVAVSPQVSRERELRGEVPPLSPAAVPASPAGASEPATPLHRQKRAGRSDGSGVLRSSSCGHVFVLRCSAKRLAADAILRNWSADHRTAAGLRQDAAGSTREPPPLRGVRVRERLADGGLPDSRVTEYEGFLSTEHYKTEDEAISATRDVVQAFLDAAGHALMRRKSSFHRSKPLMGLPLPGVGEYDVGDVIRDEGRMIELVLPLLYIAAERYEIDVALCIADGGAYYVAQVMREKCCPFEGGPFWSKPRHSPASRRPARPRLSAC